jgi:hypothetical protein
VTVTVIIGTQGVCVCGGGCAERVSECVCVCVCVCVYVQLQLCFRKLSDEGPLLALGSTNFT